MALWLATVSALLPPFVAEPLGRRAVVLGASASAAALLAGRDGCAHALDANSATPIALNGAKCKVSSCQNSVLSDLKPLLDTVGMRANAKGEASARLPATVVAKKFQGLKEGTPTRIKIKIAMGANGAADNFVRFIWLAEKDSGRILSARAFEAPPAEPPRLLFDGKFTDAELAEMQSMALVIRTYWSTDGLWELPPFTWGDCTARDKGESVRLR